MTNTQVLVVGAGPAGIAAATAAAEGGREVVVLDDNVALGGQIWRSTITMSSASGSSHTNTGTHKQSALHRLQATRASLLTSRCVVSAQGKGVVQALHETGTHAIVEEFCFEQLILATGARERFLPFPGWTLPGVFGPGGLQALVRSGFDVRGKRIVVAGTGPLLLAVAAHLAEAGAEVISIVEQASMARLSLFGITLAAHPGKLFQGLRYRRLARNASFRVGCWVSEAVPSADGQQVRAVQITNGRRQWQVECDLLACGFHLVPNTELASLLGCTLRDGLVEVDQDQRTSKANIFCAGEPTGVAGLSAALAQGEVAGLACAGKSATAAKRRRDAERIFGERLDTAFKLRPELRRLPRQDTIVCRCEDISFGRLSGQRAWTGAKLQTRCGMGPCQGRVCGLAVEFLLGWKPVSVREPIFPVPLEALCSAQMQTESSKENA